MNGIWFCKWKMEFELVLCLVIAFFFDFCLTQLHGKCVRFVWMEFKMEFGKDPARSNVV